MEELEVEVALQQPTQHQAEHASPIVIGLAVLASIYFQLRYEQPQFTTAEPAPSPVAEIYNEPRPNMAPAIVIPKPIPTPKPSPTPSPSPEKTVILEKPSVKIIKAMEQYPTIFEKRDFEDLEMYYSIYKGVGKKFDIDWRLLWLIHDQETRCSRMKETDEVRDVYDVDQSGRPIMRNWLYGAMQRDVKIYPDSAAQKALEGLEHLKAIKTRVTTDVREIAFAAWKLRDDLNKDGGSLLQALKLYSNEKQAIHRWEVFNLFNKIIPIS